MIHPTAIVSPSARIDASVTIGAFSIVHDEVEIGAGSTIGAYCEIGYPGPQGADRPLVIGRGANIRSHSVFYAGSTFGNRLVTGHRVTVRENTEAGENLQIGTLSDIQGTCRIGNFVRMHSNVFIGQHATIEDFVWMFPYVVLTNDPHPPSEVMRGVTLRRFVAVAAMSIILPGVEVGEGALVGAHSSVRRDVEPNVVVAGSPAAMICRTEEIKLKDGSGRPAYPWRRHFWRGYPPETVSQWKAEFNEE